MTRVALAAALLIPMALMACITPPPTLTVPLPRNDFGEFELLVYDATHLVVEGRSEADARGPFEGEVSARPDLREIEIAWTGGACSHRPTLSLSGDATRLRLELDASPIEWSIFPVACPAVGIFFGVTLSLGEPVEQRAITLISVGD